MKNGENNILWIFSENIEKCRQKRNMIKMGKILMKKVKIDEKWKNNIFGFLSEKYGKMSQKETNDENGSDIDDKGQNWWKMKKIIFFRFFQKNMEKCRKKDKNDENGLDIDEKGQNWSKMKKKNIFSIFSEKYGKMSKKDKNDENGSDIDEKGQNW